MKAITTKYLGPTDYRGARIKASDHDGNSETVSYDHSKSGQDVHFEAVKAFCSKYPGWGPATAWEAGAIKNGYAWVNVGR